MYYPAISPEDCSSVKSSWRLVHNKTTPFGCTLWLSCALKPDPVDELAASFEQIKYPNFEEEEEEEEEEEGSQKQQQDDARSESSYSFVDPPTPPTMSFKSVKGKQVHIHMSPNHVSSPSDDDDDDYNTCSDDEFVVIIPDCFKLDKPLEGFTPEVTTPTTEELPPVEPQQEQVQATSSPSPSPSPSPPPISSPVETQPLPPQPKLSPRLSPGSPPKRGKETFVPERTTLADAWMSRSRNPLTYAVGLINTVADLADQHIQLPSATPSAPPPPEDSVSSRDISGLLHQESDTSRFIKKKWEEPEPATPMERLISMGFANRALNSRLLKKHGNNFDAVLNELLDTEGEGYHDVITCSFS